MTGTPAPQPERFLLAPHHLRLFAFLLDYIVAIAGLKLAEQVLLGDGWDLQLAKESPTIFPVWWLATLAALFLVRDVLGASFGKWVTGITIRRQDAPAQRPDAWRRVARNLSLALFPLDLYSIFRDHQLRRLGDRWFGTVVIVRQPEVYIVRRALGLGIVFLAFILSAMLTTSWNLRRTAAYQLAESAVLAQPGLTMHLGAPIRLNGSPSVEMRVDEGQAVFVFHATGKERSADVRVRLVLRQSPASWSVGSIDLPANGPQTPPLIQAAPARN